MIWIFAAALALQEAPPETGLELRIEALEKVFSPGNPMPVRFTMGNSSTDEISLDEPVDYLAGLEIRDPEGRILKAPGKLREVMRRHKLGPHGFLGRKIDVSKLLQVEAEKEGLYTLLWHFQDLVSPAIQVYVIREWQATVETNLGRLVLEFYPDSAPRHVLHFLQLVRTGFYKDATFYRVVPGFVLQGGNPLSESKPDPLSAEFGDRKHVRGILSMARGKEPDSATSEFFLCLADAPQLDGKYSIFGRVVEGDKVLGLIGAVKTDHDPCAGCKQALPGKATQHCGVHHEDRPIEDISIRSIQLRPRKN